MLFINSHFHCVIRRDLMINACRVEGPGFESHHGKTFGKSFKKNDGSPDNGSVSQLIKRLGCVMLFCNGGGFLSVKECFQ